MCLYHYKNTSRFRFSCTYPSRNWCASQSVGSGGDDTVVVVVVATVVVLVCGYLVWITTPKTLYIMNNNLIISNRDVSCGYTLPTWARLNCRRNSATLLARWCYFVAFLVSTAVGCFENGYWRNSAFPNVGKICLSRVICNRKRNIGIRSSDRCVAASRSNTWCSRQAPQSPFHKAFARFHSYARPLQPELFVGISCPYHLAW